MIMGKKQFWKLSSTLVFFEKSNKIFIKDHQCKFNVWQQTDT